MLGLTALMLTCTLVLSACNTGPKRIEPDSNEGLVTTGVDYPELVEWSGTLTNRMLQHGFLDRPEYKPHPVRLVISEIENETNLPRLNKDVVLGRIRAALNNSNKVRVVSSIGYDRTDVMIDQERDLADDPRFKDAPQDQPATLERPRLSLRTVFLYVGARQGRRAQNTYEVRMIVSDLVSGEVVWEGFSEPVSKLSKRSAVSF
jgi:hypothetical protein